MMDLQAAIGLHQLERLETASMRRAETWERYIRELSGLGLGLPAAFDPLDRHALHLFTVLVDEARVGITRDAFLDHMTAHGIGVGVHYQAIPEHPYYREELGWRPEDWPNAQRIGEQTVSLPLSARLSDADVTDVIEAVRRTASV